MNELMTDYWSILLPEEWEAEQDGETIIIADEDEVSIIEITTLVPEEGMTSGELLKAIGAGSTPGATLAGMDACYRELEEDEVFWREWYCDAGSVVLAISHGCDVSNKGMDDDIVDDILSTLALSLDEKTGLEEK